MSVVKGDRIAESRKLNQKINGKLLALDAFWAYGYIVSILHDDFGRFRFSPRIALSILAPFREDRMRAFPLEGIRELLIEIRDTGKTHLAMMTGRPLDELLALLGDLDVPMSGSQGTEFRFASLVLR